MGGRSAWRTHNRPVRINRSMGTSMKNPEIREQQSAHGPALLTVLLAFACVYIIWGSTYLAIRVAVQTLPPLIMAGVRFVVAGALMYTWLRSRGVPRPTRIHWRSALIIGGLMLFGGNGAVVLAETMIDSNIAALLVATVPLWMVFLNAVRPRGRWPNIADCVGLLAGFAGVYVLLDPSNVPAGAAIHPVGAALVLFASLVWAMGSLYSRHAPLPQNRSLATAIEIARRRRGADRGWPDARRVDHGESAGIFLGLVVRAGVPDRVRLDHRVQRVHVVVARQHAGPCRYVCVREPGRSRGSGLVDSE